MSFEETKLSPEQRKAVQNAKRKTAFEAFLAHPGTKLALSLIPASEQHPEAVQLLTEAAFNAGSDYGSGDVAGMLLESIIKGFEKKQ